MFWSKATKTPQLHANRIYFVDESGALHDLGPATVEDLRLNAVIVRVAARNARRSSRTQRISGKAYSRIEAFTRRLYDKARPPGTA